MVVLFYMYLLLKKKKTGKESQYIVSHPELGSDQSIGSDRKPGCDTPPVRPELATAEESPPIRREEERPKPMMKASNENKTWST